MDNIPAAAATITVGKEFEVDSPSCGGGAVIVDTLYPTGENVPLDLCALRMSLAYILKTK